MKACDSRGLRRNRATPRRASALGFTLIELVAVIAIVGIIAAASFPRFVSISDFNEVFFTNDVLAALRHAQKLAVATGCEVQIDFTASSFEVNQRATNCTTGAFTRDVTHPGDGATEYAETAPSGVAVASTVDPLLFDAQGRATTTGGSVSNATVTVGTHSISVIGETGFSYEP